MPFEIKVPELGESVVEATVGQWKKQPGDRVAVGEVVVELETDKVNVEVGAEKEGVLTTIANPQGTNVHVGDVLGTIDSNVSSEPLTPSPSPTQAGRGESMPAPSDSPSPSTERGSGGEVNAKEPGAEVNVTPVARRVAEDHAVNLAQVPASGYSGRVTRDDVERFISKNPTPKPPTPLRGEGESMPVPSDSPSLQAERGQGGEVNIQKVPAALQTTVIRRDAREERVALSRRRRTIARRLVETQHAAAMLTTFNEIDMGAVMALREKRKESFKEKYGVGLGINSFFVKAAIGALKAFPRLNAEMDGDDMILKHYYDIGVAIGAEEGLVVPVLRDADRLSFADIEHAIKGFAAKATNGTLTLEDLRGGTFTITNGGVFGSLMSTPILNGAQVSILGLHAVKQRPAIFEGQIAARPMMYVALSYDHRIVDGREAVQFLVRVKDLIEDPNTLLLEG